LVRWAGYQGTDEETLWILATELVQDFIWHIRTSRVLLPYSRRRGRYIVH
jgi:hypothetical protein